MNIAELATLSDEAFERYMKSKGFRGMAAWTLSKKRRDYRDSLREQGQYLTGECPDCGEPLPPMALPGEVCPACDHVFTAPAAR